MRTPIVLVAAAAALVGPASPAAAAEKSQITLTYMAKAGYATAVRLTCDPVGGAHPRAAEACAELARTGADPDKREADPTMCMMLYQPVTAQLAGSWRGRTVAWERTYGNTCEMNRATGVLFTF
ncbi:MULTISPECIES: SSI family serine proteinase inhibitor [Actinoplanes]|uniref:SSI family serine proteinase inhibitor n=1 Tax=Actinoplanes TaxID=1865 RepID=UPI001FDF70E4|nr:MULTISPECIES: SSI family serine proteinase inhibitor [Actinoplanes]